MSTGARDSSNNNNKESYWNTSGENGTSSWGNDNKNISASWGDSRNDTDQNRAWGSSGSKDWTDGDAGGRCTENNGSSSGNWGESKDKEPVTEDRDDTNGEGGIFAGTMGFDDEPPSVVVENNIMPGTYPWGDPAAAASTRGKVDDSVW